MQMLALSGPQADVINPRRPAFGGLYRSALTHFDVQSHLSQFNGVSHTGSETQTL